MFIYFRYASVGKEISAISCRPLNTTKNFTESIAVSVWGSNRVKIFVFAKQSQLTIDTGLKFVCESPLLSALPRSLLFHDFGAGLGAKSSSYHPHLLIGLGDGNVVSFLFRNNELRDQKIFSLGDVPVSLAACEGDGKKVVFACGSRAAILFWEKETLRNSPVIIKVSATSLNRGFQAQLLQDIAAVSPLNTSKYPSCLILATSRGLVIGNMKDLDKMHIRTVGCLLKDISIRKSD